MNLITKIKIFLNYKKVGEDYCGNTYYVSKAEKNPDVGFYKRMVLFSGEEEASKVPPEWHSWLHYMSDVVPISSKEFIKKTSWHKQNIPNLTGTLIASFPSGHVSRGGVRKSVSSDYDAWDPNKITGS